jgi:Ca2+-transporting ATPase
VAALEAREPKGSVFARYTIENARFLQMIGAAVLLAFLVTALAPLERIFGTTSLTTRQWGICLLGPIAFLALLELGKLIDRRLGDRADGDGAQR